ncbi:MAG: hypothetical protein V1774_11630, partial [Candidatus Eisenbacteria bacterium]
MTRIVLAAALLAAFSAFAGPAGASAPAPQPERAFDNPARCSIAHHAIEAMLDPATATLTATDRLTLCHASGVPAEAKVPLLLHRGLQVRDIRVADEGGPRLQWEESPRWNPRDFWERPEYAELAGLSHGRQIDLTLAAPSAAVWPESLVVVVRYAGVVYDSLRPPPENYQRGFETTTGLIDPRGAYLSGTSLWYPQRFDGPCPFRLDVTVPPGWQAVSQGERFHGEAEQRVTWISTAPMDEIYLVAGPYVLREESHPGPTGAGRPIAIQTFTYGNDDDELVRTYLDATHDYLDLYSRRIGPYPFPKFALVENFWQTGYGMPGFTLLGDRVIRLPFIVHTSYGHEILHNWWGNG